MLLLKPAELAALGRIVEQHHLAFVLEAFGREAAGVGEEEIRELLALGVLSGETAHQLLTVGLAADPAGDAFLTGMVLARIRQEAERTEDLGADLTLDQVEEELRRDPVPLGPAERRMIQSARNSAGQYCQGLGNTVDEELRALAIEADDEQSAWLRGQAREATAEATARRATIRRLASDLGDRTDDWSRDLERIARTELHNAQENGVAEWIEAEAGGEARVMKLPSPGACEACLRLYTTDGSTPRVFRLSALRANGSNVGRRAKDWKPTLEAAHPHCTCTLVEVPEGWAPDERGRLGRVEKARRQGEGWQTAPNSRRGAERRKGASGKWEYRLRAKPYEVGRLSEEQRERRATWAEEIRGWFEEQGYRIDTSPEAVVFLESAEAETGCAVAAEVDPGDGVLRIRPAHANNPLVLAEEMFHARQDLRQEFQGRDEVEVEIEARLNLLLHADTLGLTRLERRGIKKHILRMMRLGRY